MFNQEKGTPVDFLPVEDDQELRNFLRQGVKSFASTTVWTKNQEIVISSHLASYIEGGKMSSLYFWLPPDFDSKNFQVMLSHSETNVCYFSMTLATAHIFFHSPFIQVDETEGLRFEIPKNMYKVQRRKDFRLPIPEGYLIKAEFSDPYLPENRLSRRIYDISAGGLSIIVPPEEETLYQNGEVIKSLFFQLRGKRIIMDCQIRYVKGLPQHSRQKGVKVGFQFVNPGKKDQEFIRAYVLEESRKYFSKFY